MNPISNIDLFSIYLDLPEVKVPQYFIESQQRWVANPDHPQYHEAVALVENERIASYYNNFINLGIDIDPIYLDNKDWKRMYKGILRSADLSYSIDEKFCFIKYFCLDNEKLVNEIVNLLLLTETRVYKYYSNIIIKRFGTNIHQYDLKNIIETGIEFNRVIIGREILVHPLDEYEACIASQLDWNKWLRSKYSLETRAATIALWRLSREKQIHMDDEQAIQSDKKNK